MVQKLNIDFEFNPVPLEKWLAKNGDGAKAALAYMVGIEPTLIDKLKSKRHLPNGHNLCAIAVALGLTVEELVIRKKKTA